MGSLTNGAGLSVGRSRCSVARRGELGNFRGELGDSLNPEEGEADSGLFLIIPGEFARAVWEAAGTD